MSAESNHRTILPKGDVPISLERHAHSAPAESPPKAKRKLTLSACEPCRKRKTKCDGRRPICTACTAKVNEICAWEVHDASLSRTAALRSKVDELQSQIGKENDNLKNVTSLVDCLMTRPEKEAYTILDRLRSTQDIAATIEYVKDGDLLISGRQTDETSSQG